MRYTVAGLIILGLGSTQLSMAAESPDWEIELGVGVGYGDSIYNDVDEKVEVLPMLSVSYGRFYFEGLEAGVELFETEDFSSYLAIASDELDDERTDSPTLKDMGDVDTGINLKLGGQYDSPLGSLEAYVAGDVSGEHDGLEIGLEWSTPLKFGDLYLIPSLNARWMSEELVNHYFGVTTDQAQANRPVYSADAGWRYGTGLMAQYELTQHWLVRTGVEAEWYSDEISQSPIVERDNTLLFILGMGYRF